MRLAIVFVVASGCGPSLATPVDPAQGSGTGTQLLANASILVEPAEHSVWLPWKGELLAATTSSGTVTPVTSLEGLSELRIGFLDDVRGVFFGHDPGACPFETTECSRIVRFATDTFGVDSVSSEGSFFSYAVQSPRTREIAHTGGFEGRGLFLTDADVESRPFWWAASAGGIGWSSCPMGDCEERLWAAGVNGIFSFPRIAGELVPAPDLAFDVPCGPDYRWWSIGWPSIAASEQGYVAITCHGWLHVFDPSTSTLTPTGFQGPAHFARNGTVLVARTHAENDACVNFIQVPSLTSTILCPGIEGDFAYYLSESGRVVFSHGQDGIISVIRNGYLVDVGIGAHLQNGEFVERPGEDEIWVAENGRLFVVDLEGPPVYEPFENIVPTPFAVQHLNVLASQDRLALLGTAELAFFSMATGTANLIVPLL